jgi:hypothetical protein
MLNESSATASQRYSFWNTLKRFWSDARIQEWRNVIFSNPNNPDRGVETCHNLICLSPDAHDYWTRTQFALKPIRLSDDKRRLDVEFHWLPKYHYSSEVDISTPPKSSEISDGRAKPKLYNFQTDQTISSGQLISLTTDDPEERPLPHFALLEMQWMLQRVAAMSGAAEIYDDFHYDDNDAMALRYECDPYKEDEWDSCTEDNSNSCEESQLTGDG